TLRIPSEHALKGCIIPKDSIYILLHIPLPTHPFNEAFNLAFQNHLTAFCFLKNGCNVTNETTGAMGIAFPMTLQELIHDPGIFHALLGKSSLSLGYSNDFVCDADYCFCWRRLSNLLQLCRWRLVDAVYGNKRN